MSFRIGRVFKTVMIGSALALVGAVYPATPSHAQAGSLAAVGGETLDIRADQLNVDIDEGTAVLNGNVHATMGELEVECPRVEIRYDEAPQVKWARGTGGVEARLKGIIAKANVVEVNVAERKVKLAGGVRLTRGKGWVKAERATIDIASHRVTLDEVTGSIPVQPPKR